MKQDYKSIIDPEAFIKIYWYVALTIISAIIFALAIFGE